MTTADHFPQRIRDILANCPGGASADDPLPDLLMAVVRAPDRAARLESTLALVVWLLGDGEGTHAVRKAELTIGWQLATLPFARLTRYLAVLEQDEAIRLAVRHATADLTAGSEVAHLFAVVGMPSIRGFIAELVDRLSARWLPTPRDRDLIAFLRRLAADPAIVARIQQLPPDLTRRLVATVQDGDGWDALRRSFADGFRLLAIRIQAQGLGADLTPRLPDGGLAATPFFRCTAEALALADAWSAGGDVREACARWRQEATACRALMTHIHGTLQTDGVSVATVFALDVVERGLIRQSIMVDFMATTDAAERAEAIRRLVIRLATFAHDDRSLRHLATANLRLLHRRIVERSAATGEHYIASDRAAYCTIWIEAAGGGMMTVLTAAAKTAVSQLHHAVHLAPLPLGFLYGLNYAASFVALQHLGLILATKQPAMTAAALSTAVVRRDGGGLDHERIVAITRRILQSQFAAAVANVVMVSLGCFAFDGLWHWATGRHWLDATTAQTIYADLSPINSLTIFYAALTGVILWSSSLVGGWIDNWSVRNRIHQGIAEHPWGAQLGRARLERWGGAWRTHIAGWATNISLGMMLGFTPAIGYILGLPLDVRHVTLNSGILSMACAGLDGEWWRGGFFLLAVWGVAVMFVLNLGVSFSLSLYTALRAHDLSRGELVEIAGLLVRRVLLKPFSIIFPRDLPAGERHS